MRYRALAVAAALGLAVPGAALAADPRHPDWPCNQIKVPELSATAVWTGPPIDDVGSAWADDPAVKEIVARLAARRTPLDDAEKTIADAITGSAAQRQQKAKLIFAGLFETLNRQRSEVMNGIERFSRRQKQFADEIRSTVQQLREVQDKPDHDEDKLNELAGRIEWETRIFEERQKTIGYVCEVPVIIERRLFALARAIAQSLE